MPYISGLKEEVEMTEEQREAILDRAQIMMMAVLNKIEDPDLYEVVSDAAVEGMETFERSLNIMFEIVVIDAS
jgi:molecular chaperone GrpE (heat shock protein)